MRFSWVLSAIAATLIASPKVFGEIPNCEILDAKTECLICNTDEPMVSHPLDPIPEDMMDWVFMMESIHSVTRKLNQWAEAYKPIARYITPVTSSYPADKAIEPPLLAELAGNAEAIHNLAIAQQSLNDQILNCEKEKCATQKKVGLQNEFDHIEKIIALIHVQHPLLASNAVHKYLTSPTASFNRREFENNLHLDLIEFFSHLAKLKETESVIALQKQSLHGSHSDLRIAGILAKHPVLQPLLEGYAHNHNLDEKQIASFCRLQSATNMGKNVKLAANIGINAAIIIAGGLSMVGTVPAVGSIAARVGFATSRAVATRAAAVALGLEGLYLEKTYFEFKEISEKCDRLNVAENANPQSLNSYQSCVDEEADKKMEGLINAATIGLVGVAPGLSFTLQKAKALLNQSRLYRSTKPVEISEIVSQVTWSPLHSLPNTGVGYQFKTAAETTYTFVDLAKKERLTELGLGNLPENFAQVLKGAFLKRVKLSGSEIEAIAEKFRKYMSRTILLTASKGAPSDKKDIIGGMAAVFSKSRNDPLPLESEMSILRKEGEKVVELGRLFITEKNEETMLNDMFQIIANNLLADPEIVRFYTITSKAHIKIYKEHFNFEFIEHTNGRDVILIGKPEDLLKMAPGKPTPRS